MRQLTLKGGDYCGRKISKLPMRQLTNIYGWINRDTVSKLPMRQLTLPSVATV